MTAISGNTIMVGGKPYFLFTVTQFSKDTEEMDHSFQYNDAIQCASLFDFTKLQTGFYKFKVQNEQGQVVFDSKYVLILTGATGANFKDGSKTLNITNADNFAATQLIGAGTVADGYYLNYTFTCYQATPDFIKS